MRRHAVLLLAALALLTSGAATNDPLVAEQYHLQTVHAFDAWEASRGQGVVVAVIDTGVDFDHPDLQGRLLDGVDLIDPGTRPEDENGHGTLVAGIVAANAGNGVGGAGAAPAALVMPVRALDAAGGGVSDDVAEGIRWAVDHGAHIINLSLAEAPGQSGQVSQLISSDVEMAIRDATLRGVLVVAASGNEGRSGSPYRAGVPVLVVGATDRADRVWAYSNRDERTLFAPGVEIISTYNGDSGYAKADGTSFATAIVSAGAALLRGLGLDADGIRSRLTQTAVPVGAGLGRVDLAAAAGPGGGQPTPSVSEPPATAAQRRAATVPPTAAQPAPTGTPTPPSPSPTVPDPTAGAPSRVDPESAAAPSDTPELALAPSQGQRADVPSRWPLAVATALLIADLAGLLAYAGARRRWHPGS